MGFLYGSGLMDKLVNALKHSKLNKSIVGSEASSYWSYGHLRLPRLREWSRDHHVGSSGGRHRIREAAPYRRANLMDGFGSTLPVIIPEPARLSSSPSRVFRLDGYL
jgi:hypothetical protein